MNNTETQYTFITFLDEIGNVQLQPYNNTTKDILISKLKTENKPYIFDAVDYNEANKKSIEYFNKDSDTQSE